MGQTGRGQQRRHQQHDERPDESADGSSQTISAMIQPPRMARTKASDAVYCIASRAIARKASRRSGPKALAWVAVHANSAPPEQIRGQHDHPELDDAAEDAGALLVEQRQAGGERRLDEQLLTAERYRDEADRIAGADDQRPPAGLWQVGAEQTLGDE